jgi:hypothetical protein
MIWNALVEGIRKKIILKFFKWHVRFERADKDSVAKM